MAHQHGPTMSAQLVSPAPGDEVVPFSAAEHRTMALPPQPAEVAALLRSVEWGAVTRGRDGIDLNLCPWCREDEPGPHTSDCALALMLARCEP